MSDNEEKLETGEALRRGWTTGACASAATKAALIALITRSFPDPVTITLPKGQQPAFALALEDLGTDYAEVGIIKDAGDDPDVTHGVMVKSRVRLLESGTGIIFKAGAGVGTVTRPGLPLAVGEPAINPVPRQLMSEIVNEIAKEYGLPPDVEITISVPNGDSLAKKTWNPRLGILGGLSILGTTGVVVPFSCSAWIHSIHRGIDVARAAGQSHVAGCTGSTSEAVVQTHHSLPDFALLDMGDFVGGMLKYLRNHPIERVTIGGGFAKLSKLAQGNMDLHSGRSQVDFVWLSRLLRDKGAPDGLVTGTLGANTALEVLEGAQALDVPLALWIAEIAQIEALKILKGAPISLDVMVVSRDGRLIAQTPASSKPPKEVRSE